MSTPIGIVSTTPAQTRPELVKAEPPLEIGADDRRLIFGKLNEVYIDQDRGYSNGWSDERVATDMGVARAWVAKVRDEFFGPEVNIAAGISMLSEGKELVAEAKSLWQKSYDADRMHKKHLEDLNNLSQFHKRLGEKLNSFEQKLSGFEKTLTARVA